MKKIDAYIAKRFLVTFFVALLLIIGLVIIFDISEKIDDFVQKEAPLEAIIKDYYVNWIPYFINMFSPLFVFITVIFFTSRMAANSEIIAILSCGVSYRRMLVPYIGVATLIAGLSLGLNLFVIPNANKERVDFEIKYIKDRKELAIQPAAAAFACAEEFIAVWVIDDADLRFAVYRHRDGSAGMADPVNEVGRSVNGIDDETDALIQFVCVQDHSF